MDTKTKEPSNAVKAQEKTADKKRDYFELRGRVVTDGELVSGEWPGRNGGSPTKYWEFNFEVSVGTKTVGVLQRVTTNPDDLVMPKFGERVLVSVNLAMTEGNPPRQGNKITVRGEVFRD